jgi:8-oxo-dGTP pyrophosphatase MutT (NUDIX family)
MILDDCAGGLVFWKNKLVILQRFNGVWLFPKGHIDPGETSEQAAVREVKEECGLTAEIIATLGETSYCFRENGMDHQKKVQWYLMKAGITNQLQ